MRFALTDEHTALARGVRDALVRVCPPERVRAASEGPLDRGLWGALAELGLFSLRVPVAHEGLGLGALDAALALEELGRAAVPGPVAETLAVAAPLLANTPWAARIASGEAIVAVADPFAPHVPWAADADAVLVPTTEGYVCLPRADYTTAGRDSVDPTRRLAQVSARPGVESRPTYGGGQVLDLGALAAAAQLVGLGRAMLDRTVAYAQVREQFGQPIGAFQAVKHTLADALLALEFARPQVLAAAWALDAGEADASMRVSMAKATASDAAWQAARAALQVHGAIAYTTEYDLHLWMKRTWALAAAWGDAAFHRARVADFTL